MKKTGNYVIVTFTVIYSCGQKTGPAAVIRMGAYMNSKFFDLAKEKQDRMINAALKIFARNGYRGASTDDMVKEAGISKGLLFHYFVSKLGLYTFIFDYSTRYMTLELTTSVDKKETDFFEIYKQIEFAKMHALKNYPYMQEFLNSTLYEDVNEALLAIEERRNALTGVYEAIYAQMDTGKFKPEVDARKLQKILELTTKGIMEEHFREGSFQPEMLYREVTGYLDMMRAVTMNT